MRAHEDRNFVATETANDSPGIEQDDFSSAESEFSRATLTVATFNIRYGVGQRLISGGILRRFGVKNARRRPSLVARNLTLAARAFTEGELLPRADIIALQEADKRTRRAGDHHIARELAAALGMRYAHAAMTKPRGVPPAPRQWYLDFEEQIELDDDGESGIALLSHLPLLDLERIELPWFECAWRPRLALAAKVLWRDLPVYIFCVHIDPHASTDDRLVQHRAVLAKVEERAASCSTIILGDFNTLSKDSCRATRALFAEHGFSSPQPTGTPTWRSGPIKLHADWIFVRGLNVVRWGVARGLRRVSDHWPVWAELDSP